MAEIQTKDCTATYRDDEETKQAVFEKVIGFFAEYQSFSGESVMQNDDTQINAPALLAEIADEILHFNVEWKDDGDSADVEEA